MADCTASVHIVDDDTLVCHSLAELLNSAGLHYHIHATAESFLQEYDPTVPSCGLVDVCLPGISGLTLQDKLRRDGCMIPLIFLTGHADVNMAVVALTNGAFGFLEKPCRKSELLELVKRAVRFDVHQRQSIMQQRELEKRFSRLTTRETSVARLVVTGESNKTIARRLGISARTVELHRSRILEKLEAANLAEFIQLSLLFDQLKERHQDFRFPLEDRMLPSRDKLREAESESLPGRKSSFRRL